MERNGTHEFQDTSSNHKKYNFVFLWFLLYIFLQFNCSLVVEGHRFNNLCQFRLCPSPTLRLFLNSGVTGVAAMVVKGGWESWRMLGVGVRFLVIICLPEHQLRYPPPGRSSLSRGRGRYSWGWPPCLHLGLSFLALRKSGCSPTPTGGQGDSGRTLWGLIFSTP